MNQDKVIKKLQLLKSIQPQHNVLNTIKKDVYMQMKDAIDERIHPKCKE